MSNLGKLSYSIYLIHPFFVGLTISYCKFKNPLTGVSIMLYYSVLLITSFLFYYLVEKNIVNLKYKLVNKSKNI